MGIRGKFIVLLLSAFLVLFAAFLITLFIVLNSAADRQARSRLEVTTGLAGAFGVPLQRASLERLAGVVDAQVCVVQRAPLEQGAWRFEGDLKIDSSLPPDAEAEWVSALQQIDLLRALDEGKPVVVLQGKPWIVLSAVTAEAQPKVVYLFIDKRETDAVFRDNALRLAGAGAALLLVLTVIAVVVARAMTEPLRILGERSAQVARGDLSAHVDIARADEIGALARAFNAMTTGLREVQGKLIQAEKLAALGQLTTGMAHEIKNPLASLKMTVELLVKRVQEPQHQEALRNMLTDIDRLRRYLDEMLAYAHPGELHRRRAGLNEVIREVAEFVDRQFKHIHIELELSLAADLPEAEFDPAKIKQVVMNLVLNAAQASKPGQAVSVTTASVAGRIRCEVRDQGPGVPTEAMDRIFEPFFTTKPGGTGLGLPVSRQIVEDHGGRIGCERGEPGALFWFELQLPAVQAGSGPVQ